MKKGRSSETDARRNQGADDLVHEGMKNWALPDWETGLYLRKRRVALLTQRMYIATLKARMRKKTEMEMQEAAAKIEMDQAFPELAPLDQQEEMQEEPTGGEGEGEDQRESG